MKCKKLRSSERCKSFGSGLEAARKGRQKGPAGPEKEKGRKPEGKGPDVLLMHAHREPVERRDARGVLQYTL